MLNWQKIEELQAVMLLGREFDYIDPWFFRDFLGFINIFTPTAFIETGTYKGGMIKFLSRVYPSLKIYSCDIIDQVSEVQAEFSNNSNITIQQSESVPFLRNLRRSLDPHLLQRPFFFLDAHSAVVENYPKGANLEPLAEEVYEVLNYGPPSVVCIHDFEVPGIPEFGHGSNDRYVRKYIRINLDVIRPAIESTSVKIYFPTLPQRLSHRKEIDWRRQFDLRGRVYLVNAPLDVSILEDFGILRQYKWE